MEDVWRILLFVGIAGGLGGLLNALLSHNTNTRPWKMVDGRRVFWPGWIANVILGGAAAALSWALYGPSREFVLVGTPPGEPIPVYLTVEALATAVVIGIGGARWLTSEVEKRVSRTTIMALAVQAKGPEVGLAMTVASPLEALGQALQPGKASS